MKLLGHFYVQSSSQIVIAVKLALLSASHLHSHSAFDIMWPLQFIQ